LKKIIRNKKMLKGKQIILIEDDEAIIDIYKMVLETEGVNLKIFKLGHDAIKEIEEMKIGKKQKPDLVLLDLILPDVNGAEILKEIRQSKKTKDILVFILSNYSSAKIEMPNNIKPDKFILKAGITPTKLVELLKEEFKN